MTCNIGKSERYFRGGFGIVLLITGVVVSGNVGTILAGIGLIPLATSVFGVCPVYTLFKVNTCRPTFWHVKKG